LLKNYIYIYIYIYTAERTSTLQLMQTPLKQSSLRARKRGSAPLKHRVSNEKKAETPARRNSKIANEKKAETPARRNRKEMNAARRAPKSKLTKSLAFARG
jgi:hypothetical protein